MAMSSCGPSSFESTSSIHSSLPPSLPSPTRQPPPTKGYPPQILGLAANEIDPNFLCGQCEELLRDPQQASCGHRFCRICLNRLIEGHTSPLLCPQCTREGVDADGATIDTDRFPDKAIKRIMGKQRVVCATPGCPWKGVLQDYASHEESCPVALVTCPHEGCGVELPRNELIHEHMSQCRRRSVSCKFCSSSFPLEAMEAHLSVCPSAKGDGVNEDEWKSGRGCPYGCPGLWFSADNYQAHAGKFQLQHIDELNRRVSHLEKGQRVEIGEPAPKDKLVNGHAQSQIMNHDSEMEDMDETGPGNIQPAAGASSQIPQPSALNSSRLEVEIQRLSERLRTLESERRFVRADSAPKSPSTSAAALQQQMASSSGFAFSPATPPRATADASSAENANATAMRKLELCFRKAETYEGMAMVLNVSLDRLLTQVTEIDTQRRRESETREAQERKIQQLEHALALKDVALADQLRRLEMMELTSYSGVLVWKIHNFAKKKQDAMNGTQTSIYSPCFYTSRFGYKMCARIYLNGDGMGKGKYVSLFFVIMRSQYDALLTWPFKQKVTLMLLDQGTAGEHVVDAFRPDPNSSSFKRPVSEMNIASGCPLFVPLNLLESNRTYVKDDTAFVKIIVDTQGLQE